jgi:hypothetical protein
MISTAMHPALAAAQADHVETCEDAGDLSVKLFMTTRREWDEPDRSVGHAGGWIVTATTIGAQIGDLVLSKEHAAAALGGEVAWLEREASERLTEGAAYDDKPSARMAAE